MFWLRTASTRQLVFLRLRGALLIILADISDTLRMPAFSTGRWERNWFCRILYLSFFFVACCGVSSIIARDVSLLVASIYVTH
jgi:hypothetical protein